MVLRRIMVVDLTTKETVMGQLKDDDGIKTKTVLQCKTNFKNFFYCQFFKSLNFKIYVLFENKHY